MFPVVDCLNLENCWAARVFHCSLYQIPQSDVVFMVYLLFDSARSFNLIICSDIYNTITQVHLPQTFLALPNFFLSHFAITQSVLSFFFGDFLVIFYVVILSKMVRVGRVAILPIRFLQVQQGQVCVYAVVLVLDFRAEI